MCYRLLLKLRYVGVVGHGFMMAPGTAIENEHGTRGVRYSISLSFKRVEMMLMTMRLRKTRQQWVLGFPGGA